MKLKYFLISGLGLMLIGSMLAIGAYHFAPRRSVMWDHGPKLMEMVSDSQKITSKEKINKIVIHAENQQVQIKRGLDFELQSSYEKTYKPQLSIDGQTLSIDGKAKERNIILSMGNNTSTITLTIPKEFPLAEIKVEGENSGFELIGLVSDKITTKTYGGNVFFDAVEGKSVNIDDTQGILNFNNSVIQTLATKGRNSQFYFNNLTDTKGTVELEGSSVVFSNKDSIGLDIDLSGMSMVMKDEESLPLKTVVGEKANLKIMGYDSTVNLEHLEAAEGEVTE